MKKKFLILGLILVISLMFCGCSEQINTPNPNTLTETIGNEQIVYTYNDDEQIISSKTIYDLTTGITTEIIYYHKDNGWGEQLIGSSIYIYDNTGKLLVNEHN